jgi:hypothetical protein
MNSSSSRPGLERKAFGLIVLFGSGEMSPTGRKIHETIFKRLQFTAPVTIGILETPTGFEVNAIHGWPERMEAFFKKGLINYDPQITRFRAWRRGGPNSTNTASIVDKILLQDYLYSGAGSPTYTVKHLFKSRAYKNIINAFQNGTTLSLGSASAIAVGRYALPVYEIFKVGEGLHWISGLDFLGTLGIRAAVIPHWNNTEGEEFDTTHCWMGLERFRALVKLLPSGITIIGIDEETALVLDSTDKYCNVLGNGSVHIILRGKEKNFKKGSKFTFEELSKPR